MPSAGGNACTSRLLDDLAVAGRTEGGLVVLAKQRLVLQDALHAAAAAVGQAIAQRKQELKVVLPRVPIWIDADPARLQQMLLNLLGNASKYTPERGHLQLSASIEDPMVVIRVEDDGVGVDEDMLPHIFELFTRAQPGAHEVEGSGIGLAVVKQLAVLHDGSIEARSAGRGKGSLFTLRLPLPQREGHR
jgi:signal transduction histidine kinase